jgi:hypothetical protein
MVRYIKIRLIVLLNLKLHKKTAKVIDEYEKIELVLMTMLQIKKRQQKPRKKNVKNHVSEIPNFVIVNVIDELF